MSSKSLEKIPGHNASWRAWANMTESPALPGHVLFFLTPFPDCGSAKCWMWVLAGMEAEPVLNLMTEIDVMANQLIKQPISTSGY